MTDLEKAKQILKDDNKTCVLVNGETVLSSTLRGVKPLLDFLNSGNDFENFSAADKTVGTGAAHLYILLNIKNIWANVISEKALALLNESGVYIEFGQVVPYIINRRGDGMCPIEKAVKDTKNSTLALDIIKATLEKLQG